MSFATLHAARPVAGLLQRSLERGRLAHAYLFTGGEMGLLEDLARTLAKILNCQAPVKRGSPALAIDCCDACPNCRRIDADNHPNVAWIRPESKLRVITIDQMRELMRTIHLKPMEAGCKIAVIVAADRLNVQAANSFLKTLEEPPPQSILILLSAEPGKMLDTILSRCLRLHLPGETAHLKDSAELAWLEKFCGIAASASGSLLPRYQMLGILMGRLAELKARIEQHLSAHSPLEKYEDAEPALREKWEQELNAGIEAEYRHRRGETLALVHHWLRDVWLGTLAPVDERPNLPQFETSSQSVSSRISSPAALENLRIIEKTRRLLETNAQEALTLEVSLLKLNF